MGVNPTYNLGAGGGFINYTFSEVATGTGIVLYNSFATTTSGATAVTITKTNTTSTDAFQADPVSTYGFANTTSFTSTEVSFDNPPSNFASVIRGTALVDVTFVLDASGVDKTAQGYIVCKIRGVDADDNITEIGETTSDLFETPHQVELPKTLLIPITCAQTTIKPTDRLRLTIEMWAKVEAGATSSHWLLHDPANRDIAVTPAITAADNHTYLKWYIPYKVDV